MSDLLPSPDRRHPAMRFALPAQIEAASEPVREAFITWLTASISNDLTRDAYARAAARYFDWLDQAGMAFEDVDPVSVAAYRDYLLTAAVPRNRVNPAEPGLRPRTVVKLLAALRTMYAHMVSVGALRSSPAHLVKLPRIDPSIGRTRPLSAVDARKLLDAPDTEQPLGLRDHAFISVALYTWGRISTVLGIRWKDIEIHDDRPYVFLRSKRNKEGWSYLHSQAAAAVVRYLQDLELEVLVAVLGLEAGRAVHTELVTPVGDVASRLGEYTDPQRRSRMNALVDSDAGDALRSVFRPDATIWRTARARRAGEAGRWHLGVGAFGDRYNALSMVKRRAADAGVRGVTAHTLRATAVTAFLRSGGDLRVAAGQMRHADISTTDGYSPRPDDVSPTDIERVEF